MSTAIENLGPYRIPQTLRILTPRLLWEWQSPLISSVLRGVVIEWARLRHEKHYQPSTITCIYRTEDERCSYSPPASPIHPQWRGIDLAIMTLDGVAAPWEEEIRLEINERFSTGIESMPRILPFDHGGSGFHAHVNTTISEQRAWVIKAGLWNGAPSKAPK